MKTSERIAREVTSGFYGGRCDGILPLIEARVASAIKADRAQHGLVDHVAQILDNRGAYDAAQLVRDTDPDDDLWNNYIGPMIDSIEDDYTKLTTDKKFTPEQEEEL